MPAKKPSKRTRAAVERLPPENQASDSRTGAELQSLFLLTNPPSSHRPLRQAPRKNRWAKSKFRN